MTLNLVFPDLGVDYAAYLAFDSYVRLEIRMGSGKTSDVLQLSARKANSLLWDENMQDKIV